MVEMYYPYSRANLQAGLVQYMSMAGRLLRQDTATGRTLLSTLTDPGTDLFAMSEQKAQAILDAAQSLEEIDPLFSLSHSIFTQRSDLIKAAADILPAYQAAAKIRLEQALTYVEFHPKTPDPLLADTILAQGVLLVPAKEHFQRYEYSKETADVGFGLREHMRVVRLEDVPRDLKTAAQHSYDPRKMHTIVLATSKRPVSVQDTILSAFAYSSIVKV